ncbi:MAG: flagellar hook-length control protein FliK, partial [Candidatus Pelethousia sp.]|nr:flagellar hook-length control protein FliK [Candidatus Pelethousia sp.]
QTETEASLPEEMAQAIPIEAQQQQLPLEMEAQAGAQMAAPWQAAVPQEGERALPRMEEPGAEAESLIPEQENTLSGEPLRQPAAMKAGAEAEQAGEHDMDRAETRPAQAQPSFTGAAQTQQHPVADLSTPAGEILPEPQARQVLTDSLFEQVQSAVRTGKQELFVQLKPESLGSLAIHLSMTEEGVKAQVRTSSENVQHLVTAQIAQLEDALRARDIPVVQMEVIYDQTANSAFLGQQQKQAWQESGGWGRGGSYAIPGEETAGLYEAALTDAAAQMGEGGVVYSA